MVTIRQAVSHIRKCLIATLHFSSYSNPAKVFFSYGNPSWNSQWNLAREILGWRGGGSVGGCLVLRGRQEVPKISSERLARIDSVSRHFDFLEFLSWYHSKNTRIFINVHRLISTDTYWFTLQLNTDFLYKNRTDLYYFDIIWTSILAVIQFSPHLTVCWPSSVLISNEPIYRPN